MQRDHFAPGLDDGVTLKKMGVVYDRYGGDYNCAIAFTMTASNSELRRWGSVWTVSQAKVYDRVMAEQTHSGARSFCPWIYDQKL